MKGVFTSYSYLPSKWLLPLKACHNTRALLSPSLAGLKRQRANGVCCSCLWAGILGGHRLSTAPLARGMWWIQEWRKKTELLTKLSVLSKRRIGKSKQWGRSEIGQNVGLSEHHPSHRNSGMLPGSSCSGILKVCTEQALSEPRNINAFCFMSASEEGCSWGYVAIEAQKKTRKATLQWDWLLFNLRHWPTDAALLYLHSSAAASTAFQKYS